MEDAVANVFCWSHLRSSLPLLAAIKWFFREMWVVLERYQSVGLPSWRDKHNFLCRKKGQPQATDFDTREPDWKGNTLLQPNTQQHDPWCTRNAHTSRIDLWYITGKKSYMTRKKSKHEDTSTIRCPQSRTAWPQHAYGCHFESPISSDGNGCHVDAS